MLEVNSIVIVLNLGNYTSYYAEETPFKAKVLSLTEHETNVMSIETDKKYELYYYQILELLDIGKIKELINLENYSSASNP